MKFYISDTHFYHDNILRISKRPFKNIQEMHNQLIANWNKKVKPDDEIFILGDFVYKGSSADAENLLKVLKGVKYLVKGNHERWLNGVISHKWFGWVKDYAEIDDNGRHVIMFHYPIEDWNGKFRNSYHLFGHIHNNDHCVSKKLDRRYNVGVDVNNFEPMTLDELIAHNK